MFIASLIVQQNILYYLLKNCFKMRINISSLAKYSSREAWSYLSLVLGVGTDINYLIAEKRLEK